MPGAKEGEVTVVQIESEGYNKQKVRDEMLDYFLVRSCKLSFNRLQICQNFHACTSMSAMTRLPQVVVPIVAMRAGTDYQTYVDLLVPGQAKISLLQVWTRRLPRYTTQDYS